MRLTFGKVLLVGALICTGCILLFNTYDIESRDKWSSPYLPWEEIFNHGGNSRHFPLLSNQKYHPHVIRGKIWELSKKISYDRIWPDPAFHDDDRILAQMHFIPQAVRMRENETAAKKSKLILLYDGLNSWGVSGGQNLFLEQKCLVHSCSLTGNRDEAGTADVIVFKSTGMPWQKRPPGQIWVWYQLESPMRLAVEELEGMNGLINWTATYRHDSTIVTPYEKFVPYSEPESVRIPDKNYAQGKTKKVAWFVSNCGSDNGRQDYAWELNKYIPVDTYGKCGNLKCPKGEDDGKRCFSKLNTDYKFYLAFENCNCRDYITEKLFANGLQHDVVPIVMGAAPEDYARAAPFHSYIHVEDFDSPKALASYLHFLDQRDDLYNAYFAWKGLGRFINTFFWCRLCALIHDENRPNSQYVNLSQWWSGENVCLGRSKRWRDKR